MHFDKYLLLCTQLIFVLHFIYANIITRPFTSSTFIHLFLTIIYAFYNSIVTSSKYYSYVQHHDKSKSDFVSIRFFSIDLWFRKLYVWLTLKFSFAFFIFELANLFLKLFFGLLTIKFISLFFNKIFTKCVWYFKHLKGQYLFFYRM